MNETDYANMLKNLYEFRALLIIFMGQLALRIMIRGLKGAGDDDWELKALRTLLNQLQRLNNDLSFYMNPENLLEITKRPMPALQYIGKWVNWIYKARKLFVPGYISDTYTFEDWLNSGASNIPIINEIRKWYREAEKIKITKFLQMKTIAMHKHCACRYCRSRAANL